jgi:hypothetical protein
MKFVQKIILLLTLASLLVVTACGDLFGKKVVKKKMGSGQFSASCELDIEAFSEIMVKDISSQIKCLGENLHLFIRVVESKRPNYLSRTALEQFIRNNRSDIKPEVLKALKAVFDINYLIFGEDPDFISADNVDKIVEFALTFNGEAAVNFKPIFQNGGFTTYNVHRNQRDRIGSAARVIIAGMKKIYNPNRGGQIHQLNIIDLLESFITKKDQDYIQKAKNVLFAKKVLIGGEAEVINHTELGRLILSFDSLAVITLDAVRYKKIRLTQESQLQLLKLDVDLLYNIIFQSSIPHRDDEVFFKIEEALTAVKMFVSSEQFDVEKFRDLILEAKQLVMQGDRVYVTGGDFRRMMNHAQSILNTGTLFNLFYDAVRPAMELPKPVSINFNDLRLKFPGQQKEVREFERIVTRYRFFKGEFDSAYYSTNWARNAKGIFDVALYEHGLKMVMEKYGSPSNGLGGYSLSTDQVVELVKKLEPVLIEMGILYPGRAVKTAETVTLLGSLFQYQSDDNKLFDVNEATEFAISLFTSLDVAKNLHKYYTEQKCPTDEFGRILPDCFKQKFFKGVCKNYRQFFPRLFLSLGTPKECEDLAYTPDNAAFLEQTIKAARTCHEFDDTPIKEEINYTEGDMFSIFLAMMHIETTIIRWDTNLNNYMDPKEVMQAYEIYSPALDGFMEGMPPIIKKVKKQIYQYLVKYEQVPNEKDFSSVWKFLKFLLKFNKDAPANRKTIASILRAIGEQGAKSEFDCNLLRDPTNLGNQPRGSTMVSLRPAPVPALSLQDLSFAYQIEGERDTDIQRELLELIPNLMK